MNKSIAFMPNENLTGEIDDTENVSSEHEDGQAISEYDPTWHVIIN